MSKKIIKLENIFKQAEAFIKRVFSSRFRIYKFIANNVKLTIIFVLLGATATVAAGIVINEITTDYLEMLVVVTDTSPSKLPRAQRSAEILEEEQRSNAKQGYIVRAEPEGYKWGSLEQDPKQYIIVKIAAADFNPAWLLSEYDLDNPITVDGVVTGEYKVKTFRKYRLPLESVLSEEELTEIKSIPYNEKTLRPKIVKTLTDKTKVIETDFSKLPAEIKLHGSSGTFTICASGCDYSNLGAWEVAQNSDLTGTGPSIAEITGPVDDTAAVAIDGWTTTASDYIQIYTTGTARHEGKYDATKYILRPSDSSVLSIAEDYVRLDGIQIETVSPTASGKTVLYLDGFGVSNDIRISNNIIKGHGSATYWQWGFISASTNLNLKFWNNFIFGLHKTVDGNNASVYINATAANLYNNTVSGSYYSYRNISGSNYIYNSISNDGNAGFTQNTAWAGGDYNISDVNEDAGDMPGANSVESVSATFVDIANGNPTLRFWDAVAKDYAMVNPGSGLFSDDIAGNPRTGTWDIGAFEVADQIVGHWRLDEGYASTTYDGTAAKNNLTLADNTTWVTGKFNNALAFDGGNDYLSVADSAALDFATSTDFTISAWVKTASSTATQNQMIVTKADTTLGGYKLYMGSAGDFAFAIDDDSSWTPDDLASSTQTNYDDNNWHQVVAVKATSTTPEIRLYVDGVKQATDSSLTAVGSLQNSSTFYVGVDRNGVSYPFDGVIDEVRVYNYALSDAQIRGLFTSGSAAEPASVSFGANFGSTNSDIDQHLVGYWNFDETATSTATDVSGFNNNGTDFYTTASSTGKYGYAREFNGTNGYVDLGTDDFGLSTNEITLSLWVRPASINCSVYLLQKSAFMRPFNLRFNCVLEFNLRTSDDLSALSFGSNPALNTWTHVAATYKSGHRAVYYNGQLVASDQATGYFTAISESTNVGRNADTDAGYFDGLIDDVKIFNAALSGEQVLQEYLDGPGPVGYWNFEEKTGTTANDVSGHGNTGTLTNGPAWALGRVGGAVRFDGTDDYVGAPDSASLDIAGAVTVTFFIKPKLSPIICNASSVTDIEGNIYQTVAIGSQCWLAENLRTTTRPDGQGLGKGPATHGGGGWTADLGYYSCPPNSSNNGEDCAASATLGMLYQWSAAMASSTAAGAQGLCPDDWHIPTDAQVITMEETLGMCSGAGAGCSGSTGYRGTDQGSRLAGHAADQNWTTGTLTNDADFDTSGFNWPPSGYRNTSSNYYNRANYGYLWSSSESSATVAWSRFVYYGNAAVYRNTYSKAYGYSVRCLKD